MEKLTCYQLKEHRELQKTLRDVAGGEGEGSSWVKQLGAGLAEAFVPIIKQIVQNQMSPELPPGKVPQLEQPQPQPKPKRQEFSFSDMVSIMEFEPKDAVAQLYQMNPAWISLLSNSEYSTLISLLERTPRTEENVKYIEELLSVDRQKWLEGLINEAKKLIESS